MTIKIAVIQFPGSNCDLDTIHVLNDEGLQGLVDRMNEELRRLSGQLRMQTQRLQRQAKQLRPRA